MQQNELAGKGFGVDIFFLIFTKKTREIVAKLLFFCELAGKWICGEWNQSI